MVNLFKIEWMKVRTYRTFWILSAAFVIFFPLSLYYTADRITATSASQQEELLKSLVGNPFMFPKVWQSSAYYGGIFFIIIGMLFILLITNEVQYRTHRQNIIDGWSRLDFLLAKFSMLLFLVLSCTVVVFLVGLWIGSIYTTSGVPFTDGLIYVAYFALMAVLYLMVAYFIAIFVKRTGLSIIIYFAFVALVDNILWLILTLRDSQVGYFLPLETTDSLVVNPFKPSVMNTREVSDTTLVIAAVAYITLLAFSIKRYFQRIDLKN